MKRAELIQKMIESGKTIGMLAEDFYKWMDGLDTHEQGAGRLATRFGYCCLGVEQKVRMGCVEVYEDGESRPYPSPSYLLDSGIVYLHDDGCERSVPSCNNATTFAELNDSGVPFAELKPLLIASAFLYADPLEAD